MEQHVVEHHQPGKIETILDKSQNYARLTFEITKLKGLNTTAAVVTTLISKVSVVTALILFVLVLSLGAAFWLGDILGKIYYGFFIIAGFYLVVGMVLHFFLQNWIKKPVADLIISQALE